MNLYRIDAASYRPGGFAGASGYGPIEDLWFLGPEFLKRRREYWRVNPGRSGLCIEPGARAWPDFLNNGHSPPMFFVSERVVQGLRQLDVPIGRVTEMPIAEIKAKSLKDKAVPRYFVVETIPGIEVDLVATGFQVDARGKAIVDPPPHPWPSPYRYRLDTWNGADLFDYRYFGSTDGPYTDMFCTERVKHFAENEGWTNVSFQRLGLV